ncbi:hypothetical protein [Methanobacterium aggregans]|uniref:hypothetical protein n=1 Tax=Methanobacterium aggregans TaxID=1615586 RepID=UPI001AEA2351|nr:hypothetical protein [Methanobacterium aggregans]MBP2046397.1 hypothetical protein [Methanobacterium aggregans]
MNNSQTKFRILKYLKMTYNKDPSVFANRVILLDECKIPDADLGKNLKHLKNAGLVDMQMRLGGDFIVKINNKGIDALSQMEQKLQKDGEVGKDLISPLMAETKVYVDSKLETLDTDILTRLNFIYEDLSSEHHEHGFARIAYDCRELLLDFSDALFNEYGDPLNVKEIPKRDQAKIKLQYVLKSAGETDEHGKLLSAKLDYILNYLDVLNRFMEKGGHREIAFSLEDAKSCFIYTYLFIRDVLKLIDRF